MMQRVQLYNHCFVAEGPMLISRAFFTWSPFVGIAQRLWLPAWQRLFWSSRFFRSVLFYETWKHHAWRPRSSRWKVWMWNFKNLWQSNGRCSEFAFSQVLYSSAAQPNGWANVQSKLCVSVSSRWIHIKLQNCKAYGYCVFYHIYIYTRMNANVWCR